MGHCTVMVSIAALQVEIVMSSSTLHVSSPGKVLISGGYLVLERPNVGLVVAASARFHCRLSRASEVGDSVATNITVHCPQNTAAPELNYSVEAGDVKRVGATPENPFVEHSIRHGRRAQRPPCPSGSRVPPLGRCPPLYSLPGCPFPKVGRPSRRRSRRDRGPGGVGFPTPPLDRALWRRRLLREAPHGGSQRPDREDGAWLERHTGGLPHFGAAA